jgi:hypothetical protein
MDATATRMEVTTRQITIMPTAAGLPRRRDAVASDAWPPDPAGGVREEAHGNCALPGRDAEAMPPAPALATPTALIRPVWPWWPAAGEVA